MIRFAVAFESRIAAARSLRAWLCPIKTNIIAPITAVLLGAKMIEIHTTLDKKGDFVDNSVSFENNDVSKLVSSIRDLGRIRR